MSMVDPEIHKSVQAYLLVSSDGSYDGNKGFVHVYPLLGGCFDTLGIEPFSQVTPL